MHCFQLIQRCPACLSNFAKYLCEMTCSPRQSEFMVTTQINEELQSVEKISFAISDEYINSTLDSCKNVKIPATGSPALDLLCGGSTECTPQVIAIIDL